MPVVYPGQGQEGSPGTRVNRAGDEIIIAGQLYHTGTRVVTWLDPGGFNAYTCMPPLLAHIAPGTPSDFPKEVKGVSIPVPRYGKRKRKLEDHATGSDVAGAIAVADATRGLVTTVKDLDEVLNKIVVHYDGCGTSARCFEVLHNERGLSCHFLIDADGTVYQTLDVMERAWHATIANDSSIGVELAHAGAFPPAELPCQENDAPLYKGTIQDQELVQRDFTDAQYDALARLAKTLCSRFPNIPNIFPASDCGTASEGWKIREAKCEVGSSDFWQARMNRYRNQTQVHRTKIVVPHKLPDSLLGTYKGLLGHYHVQTNKVDPGPAFDWGRLWLKIYDPDFFREGAFRAHESSDGTGTHPCKAGECAGGGVVDVDRKSG